MINLNLSLTKKQKEFIDATSAEVLFGGAAGGGKSYGQMADALLYALKYPGSKQLVLRRTYSELEKSLIRTSMAIFPKDFYSFNSTGHIGRFKNGSCIDFGYCAIESDVYQYQSAEYDVIRFDELTHFTENQYIYLISRLRGANNFPKQIKSTTNPGGVGHSWVKRRFVDPAPSGKEFTPKGGLSRIFIPARLEDNSFLTALDPGYKTRLLALPEREKRALLFGEWSIFEGQYFPEFSESRNVVAPFEIPYGWRKYRAIDYGLDRLVCLWIAITPDGDAYVYREYCESNLPISTAAEHILARTPKHEDIYATLAPPDLWNRTQESGKSKATIFSEYGLNFTRTSNSREAGWLALKELLLEKNGRVGLKIFATCREIIRCLPALTTDKIRPTDVSREPHEITHAPDALRGFAIFHTRPAEQKFSRKMKWTKDMFEDYYSADERGRNHLKQKYGEPN